METEIAHKVLTQTSISSFQITRWGILQLYAYIQKGIPEEHHTLWALLPDFVNKYLIIPRCLSLKLSRIITRKHLSRKHYVLEALISKIMWLFLRQVPTVLQQDCSTWIWEVSLTLSAPDNMATSFHRPFSVSQHQMAGVLAA